jgi:hypothetical protein
LDRSEQGLRIYEHWAVMSGAKTNAPAFAGALLGGLKAFCLCFGRSALTFQAFCLS